MSKVIGEITEDNRGYTFGEADVERAREIASKIRDMLGKLTKEQYMLMVIANNTSEEPSCYTISLDGYDNTRQYDEINAIVDIVDGMYLELV